MTMTTNCLKSDLDLIQKTLPSVIKLLIVGIPHRHNVFTAAQ